MFFVSDSGVELKDVRKEGDRARIILSNGDQFTVDFAVLAIGVQAQECCQECFTQFYARERSRLRFLLRSKPTLDQSFLLREKF